METRNMFLYDEQAQFLCEKCKVHLEEWVLVDVVENKAYEYIFNYCPNCGAKIIKE